MFTFQFCIYAAKVKLISDIPQDAQDTQNSQEKIPQDATKNAQGVQETQKKL